MKGIVARTLVIMESQLALISFETRYRDIGQSKVPPGKSAHRGYEVLLGECDGMWLSGRVRVELQGRTGGHQLVAVLNHERSRCCSVDQIVVCFHIRPRTASWIVELYAGEVCRDERGNIARQCERLVWLEFAVLRTIFWASTTSRSLGAVVAIPPHTNASRRSICGQPTESCWEPRRVHKRFTFNVVVGSIL